MKPASSDFLFRSVNGTVMSALVPAPWKIRTTGVGLSWSYLGQTWMRSLRCQAELEVIAV